MMDNVDEAVTESRQMRINTDTYAPDFQSSFIQPHCHTHAIHKQTKVHRLHTTDTANQ